MHNADGSRVIYGRVALLLGSNKGDWARQATPFFKKNVKHPLRPITPANENAGQRQQITPDISAKET
jgi:hypothetical protein